MGESEADKFRAQALYARRASSEMRDATSAATMRGIAEAYDRLAEQQERHDGAMDYRYVPSLQARTR
jgi:hypothetical protein